jgi:intraflagellar transport protein 172
MYKEAIDVYIQGGMRDEAISLAQRRAPQYTDYAQDTAPSNVSSHMQNNIPMLGGASGNLDQLMQRGDWDQLMRQAQREGGEVLTKYTAHYAKHLVQQQDFLGAVGALNQFGVSTQPACFDLYKRIAHEIMVLEPKESNLKPLKEVLHKLIKALEGLPGHDEFKKLGLVVHFLSQRQVCVNSGLGEFGWKLAVSLARYCNDLAADRIFYDAGAATKATGVNNMAFVFFNRFLDLTEAIDDPETGMMDNADFADTDVPFDFPLPENHTVSEDQREEVRNWVLQISMDHTQEQSLSTRQCQNCGTQTYEGNLQCHSCKFEHQPCIITGYPVLTKDAVKCTSCGMPANRNDWNSYISRMQNCPWCGANQNASYM